MGSISLIKKSFRFHFSSLGFEPVSFTFILPKAPLFLHFKWVSARDILRILSLIYSAIAAGLTLTSLFLNSILHVRWDGKNWNSKFSFKQRMDGFQELNPGSLGHEATLSTTTDAKNMKPSSIGRYWTNKKRFGQMKTEVKKNYLIVMQSLQYFWTLDYL